MDESRIQEFIQDETFMKELLSLKTEAEAQEFFKSKGLDITTEELGKIEAEGRRALEDGKLEDIVGGLVGKEDLKIIAATAVLPAPSFLELVGGCRDFRMNGMSPDVGRVMGDTITGLVLAAGLRVLAYKGIKYGLKKWNESSKNKPNDKIN